ncbi:serine protease [Rugamonas sp.]|uniref:S1 family peptidase n=1 Tax=Rugamonas sp. TaxID=1926287 RepID=UPI0025FAECFD|nr:serine protease [Rugamonas sp.]
MAAAILLAAPICCVGATLAQTITSVKPAIVGIGTMLPSRSPAVSFFATGFVVGDGLSVISNAHAVPAVLDAAHREVLGVVTGNGDKLEFRSATVVSIDKEHDLVHLRLSGAPLPALRLGDSATMQEGDSLAFTGFPLGMSLGMQPVTHRATLSAITPILLPALSAQQLDARAISQQRKPPFLIFQLDGTAYPGNSGSPLYDPDDGAVYGVINMTLLKNLKENAISAPSGISYAIPAHFVQLLLQQDAGKK